MGRSIERLSAKQVENAKPGKRLHDGGGLYLQVTAAVRDGKVSASDRPSRSWVLRWTKAGRERQLGLGSADAISLALARELARKHRAVIASGGDPIEERRAAKPAAKVLTFKEAAEAYIKAHRSSWRNAIHASQWIGTLKVHAYEKIGALPVSEVDKAAVLRVLSPIWYEKPVTASRLRGRLEMVLDYARATGQIKDDAPPNPARWKGGLQGALPAKTKIKSVEHFAALPYDQVSDFIARLRELDSIGARSLEFAVLTACRAAEARNAQWSEIDLAAKVWVIPAARTTAGREHRVPLSDAAMSVLAAVKGLGREFIFPRDNGRLPLPIRAMRDVLDQLGVEVTVHGFRSTFRDWCGNETHFPREIAEAALSHSVGDAVELAYRRSDALEKRRALMTAWADHCGRVGADNVVQLTAAR
jgi:integrase